MDTGVFWFLFAVAVAFLAAWVKVEGDYWDIRRRYRELMRDYNAVLDELDERGW